jgi:membrane protease YdiL (CAAX protease family)
MNPVRPETPPPPHNAAPVGPAADGRSALDSASGGHDARDLHGFHWFFVGNQGLRAGWSVLIAVILYRLFTPVLGTMAVGFYPTAAYPGFSPGTAILGELVPLLTMLVVGVLLTRIEQRKMLDYNLKGPRPALHFIAGLACGFAALSALVGALALGGWLHFGPIALSGTSIIRFGALWGCAFLLVGCVEEGMFRCYLQFTFTRGINFWWAAGIIGVVCLDLLLRSKGYAGFITYVWLDPLPAIRGDSIWGVYAVAALGLVPCLMLHVKKAEGSGFWQAAWATSTLFGFVHTSNRGENWTGILAAAGIGFVFVVSVRVTGSAWWAIGCHAAWDWAESYFYGTADSGLQAKGHFLTTSPVGSTRWSGGTDGPEGSLLVLGIILTMLAALLIYRRKRDSAPAAVVAAQVG